MPGRWFAGMIVGRTTESGELEFLVMNCSSVHRDFVSKPSMIKFPGGTDDGHPEDANVLKTLEREFFEETGLKVKRGFSPRLIHSKVVNPGHFKNFYFIWFSECEGTPRQVEILENFDKMSAPYWMGVSVLERKIYHSHFQALKAATSIFD